MKVEIILILVFISLCAAKWPGFERVSDYEREILEHETGDAECRGKADGHVAYDVCDRQCMCWSGNLTNCTRLRKEFLSMTIPERLRYIAVLKHARIKSPHRSRFEQNMTHHKIIFEYDSGVHRLQYFLVWHRYYILQFENLLREIDCRVTLPYWDWGLVSEHPFTNDFWHDEYGFGGDGRDDDHCVKSGPFRYPDWKTTISAGERCLKRNFHGYFPSQANIEELKLSNRHPSNFVNFSNTLQCYHDMVHCSIGEDMCDFISSSAPEFFLHHGFVDKIWSEWQAFGPENKYNRFYMEQECPLPASNYIARDFLDITRMPDEIEGYASVTYVEPNLKANRRSKRSIQEDEEKFLLRRNDEVFTEKAKVAFNFASRNAPCPPWA